jgi:hypothetical protein
MFFLCTIEKYCKLRKRHKYTLEYARLLWVLREGKGAKG